jgi:hypothetical protein
MPTRLAVLTLVIAAGVHAAEAPDYSGTWKLNAALSQDVVAKIKEAAGSATMAGNPNFAASDTWIPWSGGGSEGARVDLREFLLGSVPALESLQIQQTAEEVKTTHGEAGVRIFNLKRASAGSSGFDGGTVSRQARWEDGKLVLESKGKDSRLLEALTLVPSRGQLTYALRFEHKLLKAPLEVSLVYDRVGSK